MSQGAWIVAAIIIGVLVYIDLNEQWPYFRKAIFGA